MKHVALSASQVKLYESCPARWGGKYLEGLDEPGSEATERGTEIHRQLEDYIRSGQKVIPTDPTATALMQYAPAPEHPSVLIERRIDFTTPSSAWKGFIDVLLLGSITIIQDWKSTSKLTWAKSKEDLLTDTQANLYAYWAWKVYGGPVMLKWVYGTTSRPIKTQVTALTTEKQKVFDFVEGVVDPEAAKIQRLYQLRPKWTELPKNTRHCFSYGKRCPRYEECKPTANTIFDEGENMSAFESAMQQAFPSAPGARPAHWIPGDPMNPAQEYLRGAGKPMSVVAMAADVPPPPGFNFDAPLPPVSQFVNAPEAPPVPSPSPEAEAVRQGLVPSAPPAPPAPPPAPPAPPPTPVAVATDDLEGLTRDQLKGIAVALGIVPDNTKQRETGLREAIRAHRLNPKVIRIDLTDPETVEEITTFDEKAAPEAQVVTSGVVFPLDAAPEAQVVEAGVSWPSAPEAPAPVVGKMPTFLFVNCEPRCAVVQLLILQQHELIQKAHEELKKKHPKIDDYRQIQYTGVAELSVAVRKLMESGIFSHYDGIVIRDTTPEGMAVLSVLEACADVVVR